MQHELDITSIPHDVGCRLRAGAGPGAPAGLARMALQTTIDLALLNTGPNAILRAWMPKVGAKGMEAHHLLSSSLVRLITTATNTGASPALMAYYGGDVLPAFVISTSSQPERDQRLKEATSVEWRLPASA